MIVRISLCTSNNFILLFSHSISIRVQKCWVYQAKCDRLISILVQVLSNAVSNLFIFQLSPVRGPISFWACGYSQSKMKHCNSTSWLVIVAAISVISRQLRCDPRDNCATYRNLSIQNKNHTVMMDMFRENDWYVYALDAGSLYLFNLCDNVTWNLG